MMLAVARRGLADAINDAENGIGHLSCDDPKIMELCFSKLASAL